MPQSYVIVGGGIVGLATAYRLGQRFPDARVTVLEKEDAVGRHQTGNNSGVLHCGLYYKPGSVKARLAVNGIRQMVAFCQENGVPHEICGKLVVATDSEELPRLEDLFDRGAPERPGRPAQAGPRGDARNRAARGRSGGSASTAGRDCRLPHVCAVLVGKIQAAKRPRGHRRARDRARSDVHADGLPSTPAGDYEADFIVNCAGLHCDRVSELAGERREVRIVPFRGEYYKIRPERQSLVRNLIYPVPDPKFPFLGVHFTRLIHGGIEAGPNAVLAFAREGYRKSDINLRDLFDALTYRGCLEFSGALSADVLAGAAAILQPRALLPFPTTPRARDPA